MELKTKYQYTYFVHPFVVKESKYQKYLLKLLKDKNCSLRVFKKERDYRLYKYFLPKVRDFLFSSFSFNSNKLKNFEELPLDTKVAILKKYPCNIFEYNLEKDIQGKTQEESGIFFKIQKIEIICFSTGICFLVVKTNVEDAQNFGDILNFNYKFRDITGDGEHLNNYDNIRLQTDSFSDVERFTDFVKRITGSEIESMKLNIDTERFLTYSYTCVDQLAWNVDNGFDNIREDFIKYAKVLPVDNHVNFEKDEVDSFSKWKYAKLGITKLASTLFTSSADMNNYTILPEEYETQYFYTYILALYQKIYLKKIALEFKNSADISKTRKKFIQFTKNLWIQEITEDEIGTLFYHKLKEVFELDNLYYDIKNKYDVLYKEFNIEKNAKYNIIIAVILIASLVFNILNFWALTKK